MPSTRTLIAAALGAITIAGCATTTPSAVRVQPAAHRVTLADAHRAPDWTATIAPGDRWRGMSPRRCGVVSDIAAYTARGRALGAQQHHGNLTVWRGHGGRVTRTTSRVWTNDTAMPVLVAAWCDGPRMPPHSAVAALHPAQCILRTTPGRIRLAHGVSGVAVLGPHGHHAAHAHKHRWGWLFIRRGLIVGWRIGVHMRITRPATTCYWVRHPAPRRPGVIV